MAKSISLATAIVRVRALGEGTKFYASDLGLKGGTIQGLEMNGYIRRTGKTKSYFYNLYDDIYVKVEVFEWEVHDEYQHEKRRFKWAVDSREKEFDEICQMILETADLIRSIQ